MLEGFIRYQNIERNCKISENLKELQDIKILKVTVRYQNIERNCKISEY